MLHTRRHISFDVETSRGGIFCFAAALQHINLKISKKNISISEILEVFNFTAREMVDNFLAAVS